MNMIGGIGNFGGASGADGAKPGQQAQSGQEAQTPLFNPNASTGISQAQAGIAAQARLSLKSEKELDEEEGKLEERDETQTSVEVAGLGLIELSQEQIEAFQKRVESGIMMQEQAFKDAVNTFSGKEKTLRHVISSLLLAQ